MIKEKRILSYFIGWLIIGFIIIFMGVNNVFAATTATYQDIGYLNDVTILYSLSDDPSYPVEIPRGGTYQLANVFKFIVNIDNYTFNGGTTYSIELHLTEKTINNNFYSVITSDGTACSIGATDNTNSPYPNFIFNCPKNTDSLTLNIYNNDNSYVLNNGLFSWNYIFLRKQITTTDTSILENQQAQIIQGQEDIKDTIKEELNTCHNSINIFDKNNATYQIGYFSADGTLNSGGSSTVLTSYVKIKPNTDYTISGFLVNRIVYYDENYNFIERSETISNTPYTFNKNAYYIRIQGLTNNFNIDKLQIQEGKNATKYEEYGKEICVNKLDKIEDALTNSTLPNTNGLENSAGWLPAGPLDSILNLPLTMLNSLTNSLNKTCSPLNLTLPYVNRQIQIPCLSSIFDKITGVNGLWTWVGTIASVLMLYNYLLNLYAWVDRVLTLRAEFDEAMGADLANWGRL